MRALLYIVNASPKAEFFFIFFVYIFIHISANISPFGLKFHRRFSIQKQVNWCTIDPFSLKFCTSQHSYPVPLRQISNPQPLPQFTCACTLWWMMNWWCNIFTAKLSLCFDVYSCMMQSACSKLSKCSLLIVLIQISKSLNNLYWTNWQTWWIPVHKFMSNDSHESSQSRATAGTPGRNIEIKMERVREYPVCSKQNKPGKMTKN